jgi:hypothetical protein
LFVCIRVYAHRTLELLQTEDLERLASLPLFEEKYQRLTNVTFLELMRKVYDFGLTQVRRSCCVVWGVKGARGLGGSGVQTVAVGVAGQ